MPRKVKTTVVENGFEREVEIEVPDGPPAAWGDLKNLRVLGKRNPRPEGPDKVTGRAKYASDIVLPGMLYGRFLPSPYPHARIVSIDTSRAEALKGVEAVVVKVGKGGTVRYHGQPIAVVAAITPEIAEDALRAIKVEYEKHPFVVDILKARESAALVNPERKNNIGATGQNTSGDVDAAFQQAAATIEGTYEAQTRLHCCMETHGHTAKWDGNHLTVWSSTQFIEGIRSALDQAAGGRENVRVICEHMGGGFGSKFSPGDEGNFAVELAKRTNRPVKFMLTRMDEQTAGYRGPGMRAEIKLGAAADGTLLAAEITAYGNGGIESPGPTPVEAAGYYIIAPKAVRVRREAILTNTAGTAALRAPGHPQAAVVWDQALDAMAARLNMDPLEFRKKNHDDPVRLAEWDLGARIIGWDRRQNPPGSAPGIKKRGIGMGSAVWGGGGRKSSDCTIKIGRDGSVRSISGIQDLGTGARTYQAAIVAEELGLEMKDVTPLIGHTEYGPGHPSGGSTTTASAGPAIKMAAVEAKQQLIVMASRALKVKPEEVELGPGSRFQVKGDPARSLSWKQLCATLPPSGLTAHGEWNTDLQVGGVRGCTFAEVEVDTETGKVTVLKVVGIQDCGLVLNRLQAENQVTGGIIQGIGTALLEERHMDDVTGRMLNPNLEEYKLCGAYEAAGKNIPIDPPYRTLGPEERGVVAVIYDNPTGKVSGMGEPAVIAVQAAIANAIYNAIGVQVRIMPATPDKVLAALAQKKGATA